MHHVHLNLCIDNRPGVLARVVMMLHRFNINVTYVHLEADDEDATATIDIGCRIVEHHLELVQKGLANLINVRSVSSEGRWPKVISLSRLEKEESL